MSNPRDITDAYVPDWLGRLADANNHILALETENAALKADMKSCELLVEELEKHCRHVEKWRDRAEQKYDGACAMMANSRGPDGWEVFVAEDGEKSLRPIDWKGRAEKAEALVEELKKEGFS